MISDIIPEAQNIYFNQLPPQQGVSEVQTIDIQPQEAGFISQVRLGMDGVFSGTKLFASRSARDSS